MRINDFKDKLLKVIGQQDLKRTLKLVDKIAEDHDLSADQIAAALTPMATEQMPLYPKLKTIEEPSERKGGGKGEKRSREKKALAMASNIDYPLEKDKE